MATSSLQLGKTGKYGDLKKRLLFLLDNPEIAAEFGRVGQEKVRSEFLLPRLVRDELRLIHEILGG